jgi:hypothetical protein
MNERNEALLRLQWEQVDARKRWATQWADLYVIAAQYGRRGDDADGERVASAMMECDDTHRLIVSLEKEMWELRVLHPGRVDVALISASLQSQRAARLTWLRDRLSGFAANAHREAERVRLRRGSTSAHRWFGVKNRYELLARAFNDAISTELVIP